jgi:DNA-binding transcriptional ArsR family regulator
MKYLQMSDPMLSLIANRFKMLGEPYRLRVLQALEEGEKTVGDVVLALGGKQPAVSKHLKMLHDAGLISRRRDGTSILYAIADPMVIELCELVCRSASERAKEQYEELYAPTSVSAAKTHLERKESLT